MANPDSSDKTFTDEVELKLLKELDHYEEDTKRTIWGRKIEYLLSLIGYTVGLNNVWRFPYLCMRNGGGAFVIVSIFFILIAGFPLYYMELALGQFSGKSPLVLWQNLCPLLKGIGYSMMIISSIYTWYYGPVMSYILCYLYYSFYPTHPWSNCDNSWNTVDCVTSRTSGMKLNATAKNETFNTTSSLTYLPTAATEFWRFQILNQSEGIEDMGSLQWHLIVALFVAYGISFLCIIKGVQSVGKVVYVTAVLPYLLLVIILIRSLLLEGSHAGIIYFLRPDFTKLLNIQVWIEAGAQAFFSLGPSWGAVITMASFNKFENKFMSDTIIVCIMDVFSAFLCALSVYAILGFLAHESGQTIEEVAEAGPGLLFQTYPEALMRLPIPQLWSVLFFIMLFTVGIDSLFGCLETLVSGFADRFPKTLGRRKVFIVFAVFLVYCITSLIFATQAGIYVYILVDWYFAIMTVFLVSFLECVVIGYVYGAERFSRDIELMVGHACPLIVRLSLCIAIPILMIFALLTTFMDYTPPVYKGYVYPYYIGGIGMSIALASVVPIPIFAITEIISKKGSFIQRIKTVITPSTNWLPNHGQKKLCYKPYQYRGNFFSKLKEDIFGIHN